jgi:GNAT superfamily N-acetyltransferase
MIEYGEAKRDDLPQILELYKQLNPSNNDFTIDQANKIWDKIETQETKYFVGKIDGTIIASCYISILPNLTCNGKSIGFIENVIVDENQRGNGIGKRIIEMAIEYAKKQNCYKVVLQSGIKRTAAHRFYEAMGFDGESKKAFEIRF